MGQDFSKADKGRKFSKGGVTMATKSTKSSAMPAKMGAVKTAAPSRDGIAVKGKTRGKQVVMAGNKGMKKGGRAC